MTRRRWRVLLAGCVAGAAALGLVGSAGARPADPARFETVALAVPSATSRLVGDTTAHADHGTAARLTVDTAATSTVNCTGCTGRSSATEVLRADGPGRLVATNVAVAVANCMGCSASALAVQIVIVPSGRVVVAANRAVAVNAGCLRCRTSAYAVQYVVLVAAPRSLSTWASARVDALRAALAARLAAATSRTRARLALDPALAQLQQVIAADLHARQVQRHVTGLVGP
jgi:hypothetical protein